MKYKAIRSAAHNFGASFVSGLNWAEGDQVMSHLMRAAVSSGVGELSVDLLTGKAVPEALVTPPIAQAVVSVNRHRVVNELGVRCPHDSRLGVTAPEADGKCAVAHARRRLAGASGASTREGERGGARKE